MRRGLLVATPVGIALILALWWDDGLASALGTAILISGFVAFDAPARVRVRWHLLNVPFVAAMAGLGVLSSTSTVLVIASMAVVATLAGYLVAISLRMAIGGLTSVLALLISQGLYLPTADAGEAVLIGAAGPLTHAVTAGVAWLVADRGREEFSFAASARDAWASLRSNVTLASPSMRHALRFGVAMAVGVAIYRIADYRDHGYWVPLTILFVLKPDPDQTTERIAMRAVGTLAGLVLATGLAAVLTNDVIPTTIVLTLTAALAYALLAIEYALFTTAITIYVVLLTDTLGSDPLDAAGERAARDRDRDRHRRARLPRLRPGGGEARGAGDGAGSYVNPAGANGEGTGGRRPLHRTPIRGPRPNCGNPVTTVVSRLPQKPRRASRAHTVAPQTSRKARYSQPRQRTTSAVTSPPATRAITPGTRPAAQSIRCSSSAKPLTPQLFFVQRRSDSSRASADGLPGLSFDFVCQRRSVSLASRNVPLRHGLPVAVPKSANSARIPRDRQRSVQVNWSRSALSGWPKIRRILFARPSVNSPKPLLCGPTGTRVSRPPLESAAEAASGSQMASAPRAAALRASAPSFDLGLWRVIGRRLPLCRDRIERPGGRGLAPCPTQRSITKVM